jgi:tRNA modification GTPase
MSVVTETIVAPVTPPGRGGVGIIRVSGSLVQTIISHVLRASLKPRHATYLPFYAADGHVIDEGLAIFFQNPHSFTGEDIVELQGHGGPVVMDNLLKSIIALGARMARPGEFSERAFLNGKIDLAQAEAIADLINATSEEAAQSAVRSLQGEFSQKINTLVEALIQLRIYVEATIDFPDEELDFLGDFLGDGRVAQPLMSVIESLEELKKSAKQGVLLNEGMTVVIAGEPNVGKSSLLNALSKRESAIVTDIPGTTRDILREYIHLDGLPLHIIDTAGLRETHDLVEQEGIKRAKKAMESADEILVLMDATQKNKIDLSQYPKNKSLVIVKNKIDLMGELPRFIEKDGVSEIYISAKNNLGIELLKEHLKKKCGFHGGEGTFIARTRHMDALNRAHQHLLQAKLQIETHKAGELLAEDLRQAQKSLSEITGEFTSDELLGRIFSSFCIGK